MVIPLGCYELGVHLQEDGGTEDGLPGEAEVHDHLARGQDSPDRVTHLSRGVYRPLREVGPVDVQDLQMSVVQNEQRQD